MTSLYEQEVNGFVTLLQELDDSGEPVGVPPFDAIDSMSELGEPVVRLLVYAVKDKPYFEKNHFSISNFCWVGQAVQQIGVPAIPTLLSELANPSGKIRACAAWLLGFVNEQNLAHLMIEAFRSENEPDVQAKLLWALSDKIKNAEEPLFALFSDQLESGTALVRAQAASGLGQFKNEQAIILLLQALNDSDDEVRMQAAGALGRVKARQAIEPLLELLSDPSMKTRVGAVEALNWLGTGTYTQALLPALKDKDAKVRDLACSTINKLGGGGEEAIEPLIAVLKDELATVRECAVGALVKIGSSRALPALEWVRENDPIASVRDSASGAIELIQQKQNI